MPSGLGRGERVGLALLVVLHGPLDALSTILAELSPAAHETSPLVRLFVYSAQDDRLGGALAEYALLAFVVTAVAVVGADALRAVRRRALPVLGSVDRRAGLALLVGWRLAVVALLLLGAIAVSTNLLVAAGWSW